MRSDKQKKHAAFVDLIHEVAAAGQVSSSMDFEGFIWAAMSQSIWCEGLGISDRTLRELAKHPPIVKTKTVTGYGTPMVLYRIGTEPHQSHRHVANIMGRYFRKKYARPRLEPRAYGCLIGLAEEWPQGVQIAIFKTVLSNWSEFMAGVKFMEPGTPHAINFYQFPVIALIRKHHAVGLEMHANKLQGLDQEFPPAMKALGLKVWLDG